MHDNGRRDALLAALRTPLTANGVAACLQINAAAAAQLCRTYARRGDLVVVGEWRPARGRPAKLYAAANSTGHDDMKAKPTPATVPGIRILRLHDVEKKTGMKKTTVYRLMNENGFPLPIRIPPHSSGWVESEIDEWLAQFLTDRVSSK